MNTLVARPALKDLYTLINKVDSYPISINQLLDLARRRRAPKPVIDFYKSFGRNQVFDDEDDLLNRSEQVDIMRQEERYMPQEIERGPEEY